MSRFLQNAVIFCNQKWDSVLDLGQYQYYSQCLEELEFWYAKCKILNRRSLFEYSKPVVIMYSDASNFASGGSAFFVDSAEFDLFYNPFLVSSQFKTITLERYFPSFTRSSLSKPTSRAKLSKCLPTA